MKKQKTFNRHSTLAVLAGLALAVLCGVGAPQSGSPPCTLTDLGTLGGWGSSPNAINENGQVIGQSVTADGQWHAFVWQNGTMTDLGTLGGSESYAYAINENGQVIGRALTADGQEHAFVWQNGTMTDLSLGGTWSYPTAINENGQVIGGSLTAGGQWHAFVWQNGTMTDLSLGGSESYATAINETGQIIGGSYLTGDAGFHTFLMRDTTAPTVSCAVAIPRLLRPSHQLVNVGLDAVVSDACDPAPTIEVLVFGDEEDEEPTGDATHSPDAKDIGLGTLRLRSERKPDADGRVYLIVVKATDASGNVGFDCCTVVVPRNRSEAAMDDVLAQASDAEIYYLTYGTAPPGYYVLGDGPIVGPFQ